MTTGVPSTRVGNTERMENFSGVSDCEEADTLRRVLDRGDENETVKK